MTEIIDDRQNTEAIVSVALSHIPDQRLLPCEAQDDIDQANWITKLAAVIRLIMNECKAPDKYRNLFVFFTPPPEECRVEYYEHAKPRFYDLIVHASCSFGLIYADPDSGSHVSHLADLDKTQGRMVYRLCDHDIPFHKGVTHWVQGQFLILCGLFQAKPDPELLTALRAQSLKASSDSLRMEIVMVSKLMWKIVHIINLENMFNCFLSYPVESPPAIKREAPAKVSLMEKLSQNTRKLLEEAVESPSQEESPKKKSRVPLQRTMTLRSGSTPNHPPAERPPLAPRK